MRKLLAVDERVAAGAVMQTLDLAAFRRELAEFDFSGPRLTVALLSRSSRKLKCGIVRVTHPPYFELFNPAPSFPAQCADWIVSAFNLQLATTSPTIQMVAFSDVTLAERAVRCR